MPQAIFLISPDICFPDILKLKKITSIVSFIGAKYTKPLHDTKSYMHLWLKFKIQIYSQGNPTIIQDCSSELQNIRSWHQRSWILSGGKAIVDSIDFSNVDIAVSLCSLPTNRIESNAAFTETSLAIFSSWLIDIHVINIVDKPSSPIHLW